MKTAFIIMLGLISIISSGLFLWRHHKAPLTANINTTSNTSNQTVGNQTSGTYALAFDGTNRSYVIHLPSRYDSAKKYPLLFVFHGNGGTGKGMEGMSGFDAVADQKGFIVVYPDSNPNYQQGYQWQLTGNNNDVDFTEALLKNLSAHYPVDPTRVYVVGFSEGGGMASALACEDTSNLAGFADVSTDMSPTFMDHCRPSMPIAAIYFHGTSDPVSPYDGGMGGVHGTSKTNSALDTAQFWVTHNKCMATPSIVRLPDTLSTGNSVTDIEREWNGCANDASVSFYTIDGGGHAWPGYSSYNGKLGPDSSLNASSIIWKFFSLYQR